jgi:hypothetical protein
MDELACGSILSGLPLVLPDKSGDMVDLPMVYSEIEKTP